MGVNEVNVLGVFVCSFVCFLTRDFLYLISTLAAVSVVNHAFIAASLQCSLNNKQEASDTFQYRNGWLKKKPGL